MSAIRTALIFAAGRGERMRPLTDATPKPLLEVGGKRLIEWHLERLARAGVADVVINTSHLAEQFPAALGDGSRYGVAIRYSFEGPIPLETGGGMLQALPLLGDAPFYVVNGDVWCDVDFAALALRAGDIATIVLVDNPPHHGRGDFRLSREGRVVALDAPDSSTTWEHRSETGSLTYAGIGLYSTKLVSNWAGDLRSEGRKAADSPPRFGLAPLLRAAARRGVLAGLRHGGEWTDVGTPARLNALRMQVQPSYSNGPG